MLEVQIIDRADTAAAALDPVRSRLLAELRTPASAAALALRLGMPRQKLGYHLRTLESHGLVRETDRRRWGGLTERVLEATAAAYVISPEAMGPAAADPERAADRLSAAYLVALGARVVREVGALLRRATASGKRLATLSIDTEIRFRDAAERAAFSRDLTETVARLAAKYHDPSSPQGRRHRLVIVAHPQPAAAESHEEVLP